MGGPVLSGYLLDTHIWLWYLVGSPRLPSGLRRLLDGEAERCRLSPVSIWELGKLVERGRVEIQGDYRSWVAAARQAFPLREAAMNGEVALTSLELDLPHPDPADRFLAATALVFELTLLTVDRRLTQANWLATRSD